MDRTTRREFLVVGGALLGGALWPCGLRAAPLLARKHSAQELRQAAETSPLIYVSPLRSDGSESRCHAEVWFVTDGDDLLVVTASDRWRARAIEAGLARARVWVGDHGVWTTSDGAYRQSPSVDVEGTVEQDAARQAAALEGFGSKYPAQWDSWGPRFRKGLADGSRVLIRYRTATAI